MGEAGETRRTMKIIPAQVNIQYRFSLGDEPVNLWFLADWLHPIDSRQLASTDKMPLFMLKTRRWSFVHPK